MEESNIFVGKIRGWGERYSEVVSLLIMIMMYMLKKYSAFR